MANRVDWYFKQKVTEAELDQAFDYLEQADRALAVDMAFIGIFGGLAVAAQVSPNLTVQVALGSAYSKAGERMNVPSAQTVDVSKDYNNVTTTVATPGNTKWLSVFLLPERVLTDPRTDGNALTVFFQRAESFKFKVTQGAEGGAPTRPALDATGILLCDILRTQGVAVVANGDISTTRRENAFIATGSPRAVSAPTAKQAIQDIVTFYNNHVLGLADRHPATAVDYAGSGNFANGTPLAAGTLEAVLDAFVARVASTTASSSGVRSMGAEAQTVGIYSLTAGTLFQQLTSLMSFMDTLYSNMIAFDGANVKLTGAQTVTGAKTFSALQAFNGTAGDTNPAIETTSGPTAFKLLWRIAVSGSVKFRIYATTTGLLFSYALAYSSGNTWAGEGGANGWILEFNSTTIVWARHNNAGASINKTTPVSTFTWELPVAGTIGSPNNQFLRAQGFLEGPGIVRTYGATQGHSTVAGTTTFSFSANYPKKFTIAPSSVTLAVTGSNNVDTGSWPTVGSNDVNGVRVDFRLLAVGAYALAVAATTT